MDTQLVEASDLTSKQEKFACVFVETGDATASYKAAYDTDGMLPTTIKRSAWDVRHNAKVAARIHTLRGAIASAFVLNEAVLKLAALELAEADPALLQHVRIFCCSMCWSDDQLARQVTRYIASLDAGVPLQPPSIFTPTDDPFAPVNPVCECCMGSGRVVTYTADTTQLQGAERRLYKGYDIRNDGSVKVLMHDQMQARELAMRAAGMFVTKTESTNRNFNLNATIDAADVTPAALLSAFKRSQGSPA